MILRKPYAIIIKYFKFIHIVVAALLAYIIYKTNLILSFLSGYMSTNTNVVGQDLISGLFNIYVFIIPIVIIIFSLIFFGIMYKRQKPFTFYIINTFIYIIFLIIFAYSYGVVDEMQISILDMRTIRLIHDLLIILMGLESISFVIFFTRGIGFDITKFDFLADINKLEISEEDKEEFELDVKVDLDERKRKRRRFRRYLKYTYKENKLFVNLMILLFILIIAYFIFINLDLFKNTKAEAIVYGVDNFSIGVKESYKTNKSYTDEYLFDDSCLIVAKIKVKSTTDNKTLELDDFRLLISSTEFTPITDYKNETINLGDTYINQNIKTDFNNYLVVFKVPQKYLNSKMVLLYKDLEIKLNPMSIDDIKDKETKKYNLKDSVSIHDNMVKGVNLTINSYEIANKFAVNYDLKIGDNIYPSIEYVQPKLNTNYDKSLLKIEADFSYNEQQDNDVTSLEDLITKYGYVKYTLYGYEYMTKPLTLVKSNKVKQNNIYYIEVDRDIMNSTSATLVIDTKYKSYEITLY